MRATAPEGGDGQRWRERPVLGATLQGALVVVPLLIGIAAGLAVGRWAGPERTGTTLATWALAGSTAMVTVWLLQPLVRRLVPLAWLLRLGMAWPGRAPSRFKVAREAGRVRDLEQRLARARAQGLQGEPEQVAELILTLTAALTAHDRKTRGHAERVRVFTDLLALEVGLPRDDRDRLRWSALLHDIGKLEVPERVLNRPGKPSAREWEQLKAHPKAGHRIIAPLREWLGEWGDATLHHHERWDGSGYPQGLSANEISRAGRIVAVADAYEVMTAARSYKRPMSAAAAREELVACAGSQFDPAVVRAFLLIPLWRLRFALGPFAWLAQLPVARDVVHASSSMSTVPLSTAAGAAAGAAAIMVGSNLQPADTSAILHVQPASAGSVAEEDAPDRDLEALPPIPEDGPAPVRDPRSEPPSDDDGVTDEAPPEETPDDAVDGVLGG